METTDLTKRFGRGSLLTRIAGRAARREPVLALDGVTVSVPSGSVCALVGRNRSGKSTLLRVLAPLVQPAPHGPGEPRPVAGLHDAPTNAVARALARVDLDLAGDDVYATYSSGMRQRLALARALLTRPSVLLLDEPFRALDEVSAGTLRSVIADAADGGATVLVATHHTDELGGRCDRVVELSSGRVTYDGDLMGWRPVPGPR